ncbi:MAG: hypothetical protein LBB74_10405 [Chitinispirillales bacterium]|jgi:hypothetical protein|nr:hypothetical protein [Chitinispirillales bacterium]
MGDNKNMLAPLIAKFYEYLNVETDADINLSERTGVSRFEIRGLKIEAPDIGGRGV